MTELQTLSQKVIRNPMDTESLDKMLDTANSDDYWHKYYALVYIGEVGIHGAPELQAKIIPVMVRALREDHNPAILREVVTAIRDMGGNAVDSSWTELMGFVSAGKENDITLFAAQALGEIHDGTKLDATVTALAKAMAKPLPKGVPPEAPALRYYALNALVKLGTRRMMDVLPLLEKQERVSDEYFAARIRRGIARLKEKDGEK